VTETKIDAHAQATKKIQPEETIDPTAGRQSMAKYLEAITLLSEGG